MALEGLAALSVASNTVQFIELNCRIFSERRELYKSSQALVAENVELGELLAHSRLAADTLQ